MSIIKAITLWQPWASLLACQAKQYETRSWDTSYRGKIAIHAAARPIIDILKGLDQCTIDAMGTAMTSRPNGRYSANDILGLPLGAVIATAELVGCHLIEKHPLADRPILGMRGDDNKITKNELMFGDWTSGRYAWEFANMTLLPEPILAKGSQRLWEWSEHRDKP